MRPPKWCQGFVDRHGKPRWYLRRPGFARVALRGLPWSPEFMAAYETALAPGPEEIGAARSKGGTIAALIKLYCDTHEFHNLAAGSRKKYRGILERFAAEHGDKRVTTLRRIDVKALMRAKGDTPRAAKDFLQMLRRLMALAIDIDWRADDPTAGIKSPRSFSEGFETWSEEEIATFEATFALGTSARLALALLLYTGQRRGDVIRMGRQHVRNGRLVIRQQKTGMEVSIPLHPPLKEAIDSTPRDRLTFLVGEHGRPFTPDGFSKWFRRRLGEAGLPEALSPHGLRKAVCRRLAEAGSKPHEIMAITGHKTLTEVTRYTAAADRARLADTAMEKIEGGTKTVKLLSNPDLTH